MSDGRIEVLLTGASGFLGHYVLAELLAHPHVCCRVLLRPPVAASSARLERLLAGIGLNLSALVADQRVVPLEGELPDSISPPQISGVGLVLHAAGNTTFDANGSGEPARTNVDGTRAMLSLAAEAKIRRFVFVSTAYVCGEQVGCLPEVCCPKMPPVRNDYERSKWEAEQLVWDWGKRSGIATICRPTILFGDGARGRATTMKGLYPIARATEILARAVADDPDADRQRVPLRIIGRADATINVIPVDWAAARIAAVALDDADERAVHHITNPEPPTYQEIKDWLEAYFDLAGGAFCDSAWPLEHANHYEELFYSRSNAVHDYFRHDLSFESRHAGLAGEGRLIDRERFFRALRYAQETNWARADRSPPRPQEPRRHVSPSWYFTQFLPRTIPQSEVARIEGLTTVARFRITGCEDGDWACRFERGQLAEVTDGSNGVREVFGYCLSKEEFTSVVRGQCPIQDVFLGGGAEMFGDIDRALKMVSIMERFLREFPVTER